MLTNGTATQAAKDKLATAGTAPPTAGGLPDWERRLASYNITVDDRIIARISRMNATTTAASGDDGAAADESTEGDFVVEFDGATTEEDAVIVNSMKGTFPAALKGLDWIRALGVNLTDGAGGTDVKVQVDRQMQTTVPGVFAVGDMNSDGSGNVVHALYSAKKAVVVLHGEGALFSFLLFFSSIVCSFFWGGEFPFVGKVWGISVFCLSLFSFSFFTFFPFLHFSSLFFSSYFRRKTFLSVGGLDRNCSLLFSFFFSLSHPLPLFPLLLLVLLRARRISLKSS